MMQANPDGKHCHETLTTFGEKAFGEWHGLAPDCKLSELARLWPVADAGAMLGPLGSEHRATSYDYYEVPGYAQPVRVWHVRGNIIEMDVEDPLPGQSAATLLNQLGAPDVKTDVHYGYAHFHEGEWFYGRRGLSLLYVAQEDRFQALAVFPPTTLAHYSQRLRIERGARPMPKGDRL